MKKFISNYVVDNFYVLKNVLFKTTYIMKYLSKLYGVLMGGMNNTDLANATNLWSAVQRNFDLMKKLVNDYLFIYFFHVYYFTKP